MGADESSHQWRLGADRWRSDHLKRLGFDPGICVYVLEDIRFGIEDIKQAVFSSQLSQPHPLPLRFTDGDTTEVLSMAVELVQTIWHRRFAYGEYHDYNDTPDELYLRGWLTRPDGTIDPEGTRIHACLDLGSGDEFRVGPNTGLMSRSLTWIVQ